MRSRWSPSEGSKRVLAGGGGGLCGVVDATSFSKKCCETPGQLQRSKTPKPEIPQKKLKNYPPDPDPKFLKKKKDTKKTQKIVFFGYFWYFLVFFKEFGVGVRGVIFEFFFEEFRVSGLWIPVAGRAFLKSSGPVIETLRSRGKHQDAKAENDQSL